jgi:hypothetical protein
MLKKMIGLGLLLGVVFMVGCATVSSGGSGGSNYFPSTNGYSWNYETFYTSSSSWSVTSYVSTSEFTFDGTTTVDSTTVQIFRSTYISQYGVSTSETLFLVNDQGAFMYGPLQSPTTEAVTFLQFPLSVGAQWMAYDATVEVVAKETVTVPAGTFNDCYKIDMVPNDPTYTSYLWFGPNVGIVKSFSSSSYGSSTSASTMELVRKNF